MRWKEERHGDDTVTFDYNGLRVEFWRGLKEIDFRFNLQIVDGDFNWQEWWMEEAVEWRRKSFNTKS
jgi:hypothetical protein